MTNPDLKLLPPPAPAPSIWTSKTNLLQVMLVSVLLLIPSVRDWASANPEAWGIISAALTVAARSLYSNLTWRLSSGKQ